MALLPMMWNLDNDLLSMKVLIYVEGISDRLLLEQYCHKLKCEGIITSDWEIECKDVGGWTKIDSDKGEVYRNNMKRNTSAHGKNLLVFDADENPCTRRNEIMSWHKKYGIDFELFLLPNN